MSTLTRRETIVYVGPAAAQIPVTVREITPDEAPLLHAAVLGDSKQSAAQYDDKGERVFTAVSLANSIMADPQPKLAVLAKITSLGEEVYNSGAAAYLQLWSAAMEVNQDFLAVLTQRFQDLRVEAARVAENAQPQQSGDAILSTPSTT